MTILGILPQVWFPVITLIVGAVLKALFDWLTERSAWKRDSEARREQRADVLRLKRADFQHTTLLEFQDILGQMIRKTGEAHHHDVMNSRKAGKWQKELLGDELNDELANLQRSFAKLRVRIRDDLIRNVSMQFSTHSVEVLMARDQGASDVAIMRMGESLEVLNERIGELLRLIEEDEDRVLGSSVSFRI